MVNREVLANFELAFKDWFVVAQSEKDDCVLATSRSLIARRSFTPNTGAIGWKDSQLRYWLNGEYFQSLDVKLQGMVVVSKILNPTQIADNIIDRNGCKHELHLGHLYKDATFVTPYETEDRIFILSLLEFELLKNWLPRVDAPFWLRTPGVSWRRNSDFGLIDIHSKQTVTQSDSVSSSEGSIMCVKNNFAVQEIGRPAEEENGVLPFMWIRIDK